MRAVIPFALGLAACAAGAPPPGTSSSPIINGSFDYGKDPAVVLVNTYDSHDRYTGTCTGTFITRRIVLTAGHCIVEDAPDHWKMWRADTFNQQTEEFTGLVEAAPYASVKAAVPPEFDLHQFQTGMVLGDVGIILVDRPLAADVEPISIYPLRLIDADVGKSVRFIGFGIRQADTTSPVLEKLVASTPLGFLEAQDMGWSGGTYNICSGDSGGPSLIKVNGVEYLAAVTSGSHGCGFDSIMQRVDVYRSFVQKFIADNDPQGSSGCGVDGVCGIGCTAPDPDCPCEADGQCTTACTDLDRDPDCPLGCAADGQCQRTGCPAPDPDCGTKPTGAACTSANECTSGWCVMSGSSKICVPTCDASGGCPSGYSCTQPSNVCLAGGGGGGCGVAPGGGALGGWLALAVAALVARRRRPAS